jgi:hypothetical protein
MAMGRLYGRESEIVLATDSDPFLSDLLVPVDGDYPVLHEGAGLEVTGATVTGQKFLIVDRALIEATAPLLNLKTGAVFTTAVDAIDLSTKARVTSTQPLVKLDGATMTITSGSLVNLAGGSYMAISGGASLVSLLNGSTLTLSSGTLLSLTGSSVFKLTGGGSFVSFGGTGTNTLSLTNPACGGCTTATAGSGLSAFPVLLAPGASVAQITVNTAFRPTTGTGTVSGTGAYIKLGDATSKVIVGP